MTGKRGPWILLSILALVLFFIMGFRAGQSVEKTNKTTSLLLSIAPSYTPAPTAKELGFATLKDTCGIKLLYPDSLTVSVSGTQGAQLVEKGVKAISIACRPWLLPQPTSVPGVQAVTLQGRPITILKDDSAVILFQVKHPSKNLLLTVEVAKGLYPLIERGLDFVK